MKTILRMEVMQSEHSTGNGIMEGIKEILKAINDINNLKKTM